MTLCKLTWENWPLGKKTIFLMIAAVFFNINTEGKKLSALKEWQDAYS